MQYTVPQAQGLRMMAALSGGTSAVASVQERVSERSSFDKTKKQ